MGIANNFPEYAQKHIKRNVKEEPQFVVNQTMGTQDQPIDQHNLKPLLKRLKGNEPYQNTNHHRTSLANPDLNSRAKEKTKKRGENQRIFGK